MRIVIESLHPENGYIVTTNDGRKFQVANIDSAIKLKEKLEKEENCDETGNKNKQLAR